MFRVARVVPALWTGLPLVCVAAIAVSARVSSQTPAAPLARSLVGDYTGEIGSKAANLRFKTNLDGSLRGTLDHLDPSAPWMFTLADIQFDGRTLRFAVPYIDAKFAGTLTADGNTISGTWTQKNLSLLVEFALQKFIPALVPRRLTESGSSCRKARKPNRDGTRSCFAATPADTNSAH